MVPNYLSVQEAADEVGVTDARIRQLIRSGELKAERLGKRAWAITRAAVQTYAKKQRNGGRPRISDN